MQHCVFEQPRPGLQYYFKPTFNPGQNYLRKFSPSCPLSCATKLFPKQRLCGKKTPSPNPMLLPTNAQGSGFLLNTQQHCFQGKGEREEPVQLRCLEKCCPSIQFSQQFCPRLLVQNFLSFLAHINHADVQCVGDNEILVYPENRFYPQHFQMLVYL